MPNLVGASLSTAQAKLKALGSPVVDEKDASGQGRSQIVTSNWKVCVQQPAAGKEVSTTATVVLSSVKTSESCPGETPKATAAPKVAGIGDAVQAGDLAVTVTSAERKSTLTSAFGSKKGQWMLVTVKVANTGKSQLTVDSSDFTLIEPDGTKYETDSDGIMYIDSSKSLFLKKLNPKTSATGQVLFAVPASVKHLTLQVSAGFLGMNSAKISLGNK